MAAIDRRVLVVDDEPDIRLILRALFHGPEWSVDEAASGHEALERCRAESPDAVVLDHRMPDLTGIEVARRLRHEGFDAPIVLFSAYLSGELEDEARELGLPTVDKADPLRLVDEVRELTGA